MPYIEKLMIVASELPAGEVFDAIVYHDSWCKFHKGKACNCKPEIKIGVRKEK